MKKLILLLAILSIILLVGCEGMILPKQQAQPTAEVPEEVPEEPVEEPEETVEEPEESLGCSVSADCESWEKCIEGECGTVAQLYNTDCEAKCNYNDIIVKTSDGETLTLSRGRGSYTGAGSLAWTMMGGPKYCPEEDVPVPIKIEKFARGSAIAEEVIVLYVGETSDVITHPNIPRIQFTVTLESINEVCE